MKYGWDSITSMEKERRKWEMVGLTTRKDFFSIWGAFGLTKALRILFSRSNVALNILMK